MAPFGFGWGVYRAARRGGGGGATPPPFIETDSALWLKADAGITLNGSNVSAWADQSTHGNDVAQNTGADQPLFVSSGINGQPSLDFTGGAYILRSTYTQGDLPVDAEVFAVHREATPPGTNAMVVGSGSSNQRLDVRYTVSSGGVYQTVGTVTGVQTTSVNWSNGEDAIVNAGGGASGFITRVAASGETTDTLTQITATGMTGVSLGNYFTGASQENNGLIAEVIIFPRTLTSTERSQVLNYLATKYGIPYAPPQATAPDQIANLAYWLQSGDIVDAGGNVTSWPPSVGTGTPVPLAGNVNYVSNWRNGKPAIQGTAALAGNGGRLQVQVNPTFTPIAGGVSWLFACRIPAGLGEGQAAAVSTGYEFGGDGKPFILYFVVNGGTLRAYTARNTNDSVEFSTDLTAHAGSDAVFVVRQAPSEYRMTAFIDGVGLIEEGVASGGTGTDPDGIALGGFSDSGGGNPNPIAEVAAYNRALTNSEMASLALWGAQEFGM